MLITLEREGIRRKVLWQTDYVSGKRRYGPASENYTYGSCANIRKKEGERIVALKVLAWELK
jgi:hypothetical protein